MTGPVLVGLDGSDASWRALERARQLSSALDTELVAAFVPHHPAITEFAPEALAAERQVEAELEAEIAAGLGEAAPGTALLVRTPGKPGPELVELADEIKAEMIVVATRGRGIVRRAALGSVAHHLVSHATVPVVVER